MAQRDIIPSPDDGELSDTNRKTQTNCAAFPVKVAKISLVLGRNTRSPEGALGRLYLHTAHQEGAERKDKDSFQYRVDLSLFIYTVILISLHF